MRFILLPIIAIIVSVGLLFGQPSGTESPPITDISELEKLYNNADYTQIIQNEEKFAEFLNTDQSTSGQYYNMLGIAFLQTDKPDKSELYFQNAIKAEGDKSGSDELLNAYHNLGSSQLRLNKLRDASDTYKKLLKINSKHIAAVTGYADYLMHTGQYKEAEKFVLEKFNDNPVLVDSEKALYFEQLGRIYKELRLENKARSYYLEAFYVLSFGEGDLEEQLVFNLKDVGDLYFSIKEYEAAFRAYQQAFDRSVNLSVIHNQDEYFRLREKLLQTQIYLGNFLQGIFTLNALIAEESEFYGKYNSKIANLYLIESDLFLKINNESEALNALSKAEEILSLFSFDPEALLEIYNRKSSFFEDNNKPEKALEFLNNGLQLVKEKFPGTPVEGEFLYRSAKQYSKLGQWDNALSNLQLADQIFSSELGKHHPLYYEAEIEEADILYYKGNIEGAVKKYTDGLKGMLSCYYEASPAFSEQQKVRYLEKVEPTYFKLLHITMMEADSISSSLNNDLYSLSISIDNLLFEKDFDYYVNLWSTIEDDKSANELIDWLDNLDRLKNYYLSPYPFEMNQVKVIESINGEIDDQEELLSKRSTEFSEAREHNLKTWDAVSSHLRQKQVAIDVSRFPDYLPESRTFDFLNPNYAYFIIKPESKAEIHFLDSALEIETKYLSYLRSTLDNEIPDYYSYDIYWKPIEEYTENADLVYFSAKGAYSLFNLNALQNPEDSLFVIDKVEIRYVNTTWNIASFDPMKKLHPPRVYLFGEPDYSMNRKEFITQNPDEVKIQYDPALVAYQKEEISEHMNWNEYLYSKKGKRDELAKIDSLYEAKDILTRTFTGTEVKEENLTNLEEIRSVYFSANAYFLENKYPDTYSEDEFYAHPLNRSGMVLSGAYDYLSREDTYDYASNEDGLLTGIEISRLDLQNSELIFLSATDCNLGIIKNWESVKHLQQAFDKARASSIVMSLWNSEPDKEIEMTGYFYEHLLSGEPVFQAFRSAQKQMREKYVHPANWGAFIYIGE